MPPIGSRRSIASGAGDADWTRTGGRGSFGERNSGLWSQAPLVGSAHELTQQEDEFVIVTTAGEPDGEWPGARDPLQSHAAAAPRHPAELCPAAERRPGGTDPA